MGLGRLRTPAAVLALAAATFAATWAVGMLIVALRAQRLAETARRASVEGPAVEEVRSAVARIVAGTRFATSWQVNGPYDRTRLNVYVVSLRGDGAPETLASFRNNCSAAARWSVIICDAAMLDSFLDRRGVLAGLAQARVVSARRAFVTWIIGHEIGHIVSGHEAAHFAPSALEEQVVHASESHRFELAADEFVMRQLAGDPGERLAIENLALDLVNSEIRRVVGQEKLPAGAGLIFDYKNENVVRYLHQGSHPEYFVRGARMLEIAGRRPDNEPLRRMVEPLIEQLGGKR